MPTAKCVSLSSPSLLLYFGHGSSRDSVNEQSDKTKTSSLGILYDKNGMIFKIFTSNYIFNIVHIAMFANRM